MRLPRQKDFQSSATVGNSKDHGTNFLMTLFYSSFKLHRQSSKNKETTNEIVIMYMIRDALSQWAMGENAEHDVF